MNKDLFIISADLIGGGRGLTYTHGVVHDTLDKTPTHVVRHQGHIEIVYHLLEALYAAHNAGVPMEIYRQIEANINVLLFSVEV